MRSFFPWKRAYLNTLLAKCDIQEAMVINLYMADPNGDKKVIAEKLGITVRMVTNILKRPHVQKYRLLIQQEMFKEMGKTAEDITKDFIEIQDRCMQGKEVLDKDGKPVGEWTFDANNALRATENLAKHIGYYEKDNEQQRSQAPMLIINGPANARKPIEATSEPNREAVASLPSPENAPDGSGLAGTGEPGRTD